MRIHIVVDMQNDFITGPLGTPEARAIVPKMQKYLYNTPYNDEIVFTRDTHNANYLETPEGKILPIEHCIINTPGWQIEETLYKEVVADFINKPTFGSTKLMNYIGAMLGSASDEELELIFCGVCTDICVVSNVLMAKAFYPDAKITVLANLCAGTSPQRHEAALEVMQSCQINVINED